MSHNHPEDSVAFWFTISCALAALFVAAPALQPLVDRGGAPMFCVFWATTCSAALLWFFHIALPMATVVCSLPFRQLAPLARPVLIAALGLAADSVFASELEQFLSLFLDPQFVSGARLACDSAGILSIVPLLARAGPSP